MQPVNSVIQHSFSTFKRQWASAEARIKRFRQACKKMLAPSCLESPFTHTRLIVTQPHKHKPIKTPLTWVVIAARAATDRRSATRGVAVNAARRAASEAIVCQEESTQELKVILIGGRGRWFFFGAQRGSAALCALKASLAQRKRERLEAIKRRWSPYMMLN
jgi:hypothetical protein